MFCTLAVSTRRQQSLVEKMREDPEQRTNIRGREADVWDIITERVKCWHTQSKDQKFGVFGHYFLSQKHWFSKVCFSQNSAVQYCSSTALPLEWELSSPQCFVVLPCMLTVAVSVHVRYCTLMRKGPKTVGYSKSIIAPVHILWKLILSRIISHQFNHQITFFIVFFRYQAIELQTFHRYRRPCVCNYILRVRG